MKKGNTPLAVPDSECEAAVKLDNEMRVESLKLPKCPVWISGRIILETKGEPEDPASEVLRTLNQPISWPRRCVECRRTFIKWSAVDSVAPEFEVVATCAQHEGLECVSHGCVIYEDPASKEGEFL